MITKRTKRDSTKQIYFNHASDIRQVVYMCVRSMQCSLKIVKISIMQYHNNHIDGQRIM